MITTRKRPFIHALAAATALSLLTTTAGAQQRENPSMVLRVTTHLVIVDAVVTDRSGNPVLDLTREDFNLHENGRVQDIRVFSFQGPPLREVPQTSRQLPENIFTNIPDLNAQVRPPTVLLIDALNTPTADRVYLQQQLTKYLQSRAPQESVGIYMLGASLRLLQDFTTDPGLLKEAIKRFWPGASGVANEHPEDSIDTALEREIGDTSDLDPEIVEALREFMDHRVTAQTEMRVKMTLDALRRIGRNLAGYPGRKNLIWASAAFPMVVISGVSGLPTGSHTDDMRRTANVLTDSQIAMYPVDPRGLVNYQLPDITLTGRASIAAMSQAEISRRAAALESVHDSMKELAEQTGGRAFYNRNDIDGAIAEGISDGAVYYTLGYYPTDKNWNGRFRKIEVTLRRPNLQVRSRKGYFATDPEKAIRLDLMPDIGSLSIH